MFLNLECYKIKDKNNYSPTGKKFYYLIYWERLILYKIRHKLYKFFNKKIVEFLFQIYFNISIGYFKK